MSTSPEDTNPAHDSATAPGGEAAESTGAGGATTAVDTAPADGSITGTAPSTDAGDAFLSGTSVSGPPASNGLFSAEAFSVVGLMLFAITTLNTRLLQLFGWFVVGGVPTVETTREAGMLSAEVIVAGGLSALAVLAGAVALFTGNTATRSWARWTAAATVVVGCLLLLVSVLTFVGLPTGG